jgi:hypothetical protein
MKGLLYLDGIPVGHVHSARFEVSLHVRPGPAIPIPGTIQGTLTATYMSPEFQTLLAQSPKKQADRAAGEAGPTRIVAAESSARHNIGMLEMLPDDFDRKVTHEKSEPDAGENGQDMGGRFPYHA